MQLWYTDEASAGGTLPELCTVCNWYDLFCSHDPSFGYHPEPIKSCVVLMNDGGMKLLRFRGSNGTCIDFYVVGFIGSCSKRVVGYVMS